jgi:dihydrolipoamide dehydrogenase
MFDLLVIGGGPAGYVCAIRAAQNGLSVACVDRRPTLGGTCLNVGCIPSKALLHASERYAEATGGTLSKLGIACDGVRLDLPGMLAHKDRTVADTVRGVDYLFRKHHITRLTGSAAFDADGAVRVDGEVVAARHVAIATGSAPVSLPGLDIDEQQVVSSTGALALDKVPERLVVIGGGVIGLELGSVWQRLGSQVTVVEYADRIAAELDSGAVRLLQRSLQKQGIAFRLGHKVTGAERGADGVRLTAEPVGGGETVVLDCDVALVAIGRAPFVDGLGLDAIGIARDARGRIEVDAGFQTTRPGIFAIGDVIAGPMLAHKAEDDGIALADRLAGKPGHVDYDLVPSVIYTAPEVASVGATEDRLKADGTVYRVGQFPLTANARARAMLATEGFVKILACAETDRILGVHIVAPDAGDMIAEAALALSFRASAEDIGLLCHAHPTLSEAIREAALAVSGRALHV